MLAPVAGQIVELMRSDGRYKYIDELRRVLADQYGPRFFDYFDLRGISPDSEFLDGFHGGEVTYMRMVAAAAARPNSPLRGFVDVARLEERIREASGRTYDPQNPLYPRFFGGPVTKGLASGAR